MGWGGPRSFLDALKDKLTEETGVYEPVIRDLDIVDVWISSDREERIIYGWLRWRDKIYEYKVAQTLEWDKDSDDCIPLDAEVIEFKFVEMVKQR